MFHRRAMANPARIDRDDEKRMLPCRYFLAGFCHKGPRCKFFHPNMHIREPFVQVPDLPTSFLANSQNARRGGEFSGGVPSLFDMPGPRSRNDRAGLRTPSSANSASASLSDMHIREPFVPDLPTSFLTNSQNARRSAEFSGGVPSLFDMTGSRNDRAGLGTPSSANSASASSLSPRSRSRNREMVSYMLSPTSHAYSDYYQSYVSRMKDYDDEEEDDDSNENSSSPDRKPVQNTVFNHIDWSEFLAPGVSPPVPTFIPDKGAA